MIKISVTSDNYNFQVKLFTFWLALAIIAVIVLLIRTKLNVKASTVTRKTFHVLASAVFLSGIIYNVRLMTLAAGFGLGLLILIEVRLFIKKLDLGRR